MTPGEFRLRVVYATSGRLRWLSHLETARTLERVIRRACLPYALTQGFHPHMKIAFGPALPVGVGGHHEAFDVWLTRYTVKDELLRALQASAPESLLIEQAGFVPDATASLAAALTIGLYEIDVEGVSSEAVTEALRAAVVARDFSVEHKGKTKVFDLSACLPKEPRVTDREGGAVIELAVRMGQQGSLRPDVLIGTVLQDVGITPGAVITTRTDLLIEMDDGVWSRPL